MLTRSSAYFLKPRDQLFGKVLMRHERVMQHLGSQWRDVRTGHGRLDEDEK
jgi:hypothetical protein